DELRAHADQRVDALHARGIGDAVLYDPRETSVGGIHAMFIVRGDPAAYNLPAQPEVPTIYLRDGWRSAAAAALLAIAGTALAFLGSAPQTRVRASGSERARREVRRGEAPRIA
ncbi:MAG TPA: hypothetical protein VNR64_16930, partial [Vicinamibacterales bacterium]|nr:hypothetical protein [Vicinamibacterales bacterium]